MFHLFKHSKGKLKGKYDFAFISRGKYICGSNQGYSRKQGVYNAIITIAKTEKDGFSTYIQDDTDEQSWIREIFEDGYISSETTNKKKYQP